jgi:LEA14-like dessication related protein
MKKYIVIGSIAALGIGLLAVLRQFDLLMQHELKVVGKKITKLSSSNIAFTIFVAFKNTSLISFNINSQRYKVYINDKYISEAFSSKAITVKPKETTVMPVNVDIVPQNIITAIGADWASMILKPETVNIRIDFEINLSLFGLDIPVKNKYATTLKELMSSK